MIQVFIGLRLVGCGSDPQLGLTIDCNNGGDVDFIDHQMTPRIISAGSSWICPALRLAGLLREAPGLLEPLSTVIGQMQGGNLHFLFYFFWLDFEFLS